MTSVPNDFSKMLRIIGGCEALISLLSVSNLVVRYSRDVCYAQTFSVLVSIFLFYIHRLLRTQTCPPPSELLYANSPSFSPSTCGNLHHRSRERAARIKHVDMVLALPCRILCPKKWQRVFPSIEVSNCGGFHVACFNSISPAFHRSEDIAVDWNLNYQNVHSSRSRYLPPEKR